MSKASGFRKKFPIQVPKNALEARLAIARDVLKHLESKKLLARRGLYIDILEYEPGSEDRFDDMAVSLYLEETQSQCKVCAIGAACLVAVGLYNDAPLLEEEWHDQRQDYENPTEIDLDSEGMHEVLIRWFSAKQLGLIENAFESTNCYGFHVASVEERAAAKEFRPRTEGYMPEEVLRDIFQNILDNDGEFKP